MYIKFHFWKKFKWSRYTIYTTFIQYFPFHLYIVKHLVKFISHYLHTRNIVVSRPVSSWTCKQSRTNTHLILRKRELSPILRPFLGKVSIVLSRIPIIKQTIPSTGRTIEVGYFPWGSTPPGQKSRDVRVKWTFLAIVRNRKCWISLSCRVSNRFFISVISIEKGKRWRRMLVAV